MLLATGGEVLLVRDYSDKHQKVDTTATLRAWNCALFFLQKNPFLSERILEGWKSS